MTHFVEVPNFPELHFGKTGEEEEDLEKEGVNLTENRKKGSGGKGGSWERERRKKKRMRKGSCSPAVCCKFSAGC